MSLETWVWLLFGVGLGGHLLLLGATALQWLRPDLRLWPPPGRASWQFRLTWAVFLIATTSTIGIGVLDWNRLGWPASIRLPLAGLLIAGGLGLAFWGMHVLSVRQTLGLEGDLATGGPYQWTRNPQYLGDLAATLGWMVLTGSGLVVIAGLPALAWYLLLPRVEEPWLAERFGAAYRRYTERVPRFI